MQRYRKCLFVMMLILLLLLIPGCRGTRQGSGDEMPADTGTKGEPEDRGPEKEQEQEEGTGEEAEDKQEEEDEEEKEADQEGEAEEEAFSREIQLVVTVDSLALRKTPGTEDKGPDDVLARLKEGSKVFLQDLHDNEVEADGFLWWEVYDPDSREKGWCAAQYLLYGEAHRTGTVDGSITFPGGHIPDGFTVVAEDAETGQEYKTDEIIYASKFMFGVGFSLQVPPGNYYFYAVEPFNMDYRAYFDEYVQKEFSGDSFEAILVTVQEGDLVEEVIVGNWWREGYP